ncbi:MAG: serine/threonine protein kinase, partial [Solirubrobacterales bacterium]|nr:serine/threonine protein kinase [Solirubrobacterales bacterium]
SYSDHKLANAEGPKDGVGIYVDARPGVAAVSLTVQTAETGWRAEIYAADSVPEDLERDTSLTQAGWRRLASGTVTRREQRFRLDTGGRSHRYYLVWISQLPPDQVRVEIDEVALERRR